MRAIFGPVLLAALLAIAGGLVLTVVSAQRAGAGQGTPPPPMMMQMMAEHQKMAAEMRASQERLDNLVAKMNDARGTDKVDRMAAVVTEMVKAHRQMTDRMMAMPADMMQSMGMEMPRMGPAPQPAPEGHPEHPPLN